MFSCEFCQISKNIFFTEHLWTTASILLEGRKLKQIEISIISKLTKQSNKEKKNVLTFFIFYLLCSSFFFSGFTFYKEALCFIIFILPFCSNMLNLENIFKYIRQKLKKHAHFKISSQDELFTRLFFFFSFWDEISSLSFIPGWNFISAKTCKQ